MIQIKNATGTTEDCITWDFVYTDTNALAFTLKKEYDGFSYKTENNEGFVSNSMFIGDCHSVQDISEWVLAQIQFGDNK